MMRSIPVMLRPAIVMTLLAIGPVSLYAAAAQSEGMSAPLTFATPDEAVAALVGAVKLGDQKRMFAVLGPGSEALINSGDPTADAVDRQTFVAHYEAQHKLTEVSPDARCSGCWRQRLAASHSRGASEWTLGVQLARRCAGDY